MLKPGETVQSQYAASPIILALVESLRATIAPDADIALFYDMVFNVATAQGVGLDIWGRIVGIGRVLAIEEVEEFFGFEEADFEPFDQAPFYTGVADTRNVALSDDAYRALILWKAAANIGRADAASLNALLQALFPGREIFVLESGVMAIRLFIWTLLEPYQRSILRNYGLIAKGAGVKLEWIEIPLPVFGFNEAGYEPFDQGQFYDPAFVLKG